MVRTRIAPSPTGEDLHIGNAYTALINYAFAKKHNGKFIVRIEDTDRQRTIVGSEARILASLKWLGLLYDEGPDVGGPYAPYRQSKRLKIYRQKAEELVRQGNAYYCFCSPTRLNKMRDEQRKKGLPPKYDRKCLKLTPAEVKKRLNKNEPAVIRLKIPPGETIFTDFIRGEIKIDNRNIDDQVLIKSDGYPTYHLAVVVDDYLMKISHIIRGEEWISSTPKQVILYRFFSWKLPKYVHLPLLRNPDKSKLSKRKNPVWISWYKKEGFLPEAILNYLALMGWSHPQEKEIFSLAEFIKVLSLKRIQPVGPVFDVEKLKWLNGVYIRKTQNSKLKTQIYKFLDYKYPEEVIEKTIPLIKDRIKTLSDYLKLCQFFFERPVAYQQKVDKKIVGKALKMLEEEVNWQAKNLYKKMADSAVKLGVSKSKLFMDLRVAITGKKIGPPLFESMEVLGRAETLSRLSIALEKTT